MAVKEEKPPHSPVLPLSPFSPTIRHDTHKPDNKHSESKTLVYSTCTLYYSLYSVLYSLLKDTAGPEQRRLLSCATTVADLN